MAHRMLALTLLSAHNLKDVNLFSRMEVYGVVSLHGDPRTRQHTETDRDGARHPTWDPDHELWFTVPPTAAAAAATASGARLHVLLRTERLFSFCDGDVGEVFIPLAGLLAGACDSDSGGATLSFQVRKVQYAERRRSTLSVSYRFGPVIAPFVPVPHDPYQLQRCQCCPRPHAYTPNYQGVCPDCPPSFPSSQSHAAWGWLWRRRCVGGDEQYSHEQQLRTGGRNRVTRRTGRLADAGGIVV